MRRRRFLLACVVAAQAVALGMVAQTPFLNDDSPNQTIKGYIASHHQTFWSFLGGQMSYQWHTIGRFMPVGLVENYGLHYLLHDRVVYKLIIVGLTITAVLCVAGVLVAMSVPSEVALLGAGLASVTFQLHNFHDPLLAYAGITQLVTILYALSVLAFLRWLRVGDVWRLVASLVLILTANLLYEAAYPLVGLHIAAALLERRRLRTLIGPLAVTALFVLPPALMRSGASGAYGINLAPARVASTLGRQLSAPLPLANYLDRFGPRAMEPATSHPQLVGLLIGLFLLPVLLAAGRAGRGWRPAPRVWAAVLVVCVTLLVLPAGLVAVAVRYQQELRWGVGYLPVLYGYVAVGIVGALAFWLLSQRVPVVPLALTTALVLGVLAALNAEGNSRVVAAWTPVARARDQIDDALRAGLLDDTSSETMLLFDRRQVSYPEGPWIPGYNWGIDNWFYTISGRRVRTLTVDPAEPLAAQCQDNTGARAACGVPDDPIDWVTTARGADARWILMTPLPSATLTPSADLYTAPAAGRARLAIRSRSSVVLAALQVQWLGADGTTLASETSALHLVRQRGSWSMLDVDVPAGAAASSGAVSEPSR